MQCICIMHPDHCGSFTICITVAMILKNVWHHEDCQYLNPKPLGYDINLVFF